MMMMMMMHPLVNNNYIVLLVYSSVALIITVNMVSVHSFQLAGPFPASSSSSVTITTLRLLLRNNNNHARTTMTTSTTSSSSSASSPPSFFTPSILFASSSSNSSSSNSGGDGDAILSLLSPMSAKPDQMSASSLAYLGDVLFELFVRSRYIWPSRRMSDLQNKVVSVVRAEAQSQMLQKFVQLFPLTSIEQSVLARGRNANLTASKKSKGENITAYQDSSAFEALLGYTYICDKYRFIEMISWMKKELDELDAVH